MLDYFLLGKALLLAALTSAGVLLLLSKWRSFGWLVALGAGCYHGCVLLDIPPRWPPREDRDRFLVILLPLTLAVELAAATIKKPRWLAWLPRLFVAAVAAPLLLYNSSYVTDLSGPNTAEWTEWQAILILVGLAISLALPWVLLEWLQTRTTERSVALMFIPTCAAAGLTVMLSGYYTGGLLGLALTAAVTGATLASFLLAASPAQGLGVILVGLFAVLLNGHFFGSLPLPLACTIWCAPLLAWLPECPGLRRLGPRPRVGLALLLVTVPLLFVVVHAYQKFQETSRTPSSPFEL